MIAPGAVVRDSRNETWVAHSKADDGRWWRCVRRLADGRLSCKIIGQGDLVEVTPAPSYQVGAVIVRDGVDHTVVSDDGDSVTFTVGASRFPTRGGEYLYLPPGNSLTIPKSDIVVEGMP